MIFPEYPEPLQEFSASFFCPDCECDVKCECVQWLRRGPIFATCELCDLEMEVDVYDPLADR